MKCSHCQKDFEPPHFNSKCCSEDCRIGARRAAHARYKKTAKGVESEMRWRKSPARKQTEERYRSKPEAKALSVARVGKYSKTDKGKIVKLNADHRRRMTIKSGKVTAKEWADKLKEYNYCCANCGIEENIQMDHIHPLAKGGEHCIDNIQPLCGSCNSSKGAKLQWVS